MHNRSISSVCVLDLRSTFPIDIATHVNPERVRIDWGKIIRSRFAQTVNFIFFDFRVILPEADAASN